MLQNPNITISVPNLEADILDRSHSDPITKALAVVQSVGLVIQSIARVACGLSISQLELATMAFILCAAVMYRFWWNKPFNVERRSIVVGTLHHGTHEYPSVKAICPLHLRVGDTKFADLIEYLLPERAEHGFWPGVAFHITGSLFSAVHVAAWNWTFRSPLIQLLWRCFSLSALASTLSPLFITVSLAFILNFPVTEKVEDLMYSVGSYLALLGLIIYFISRLGILVLTFYCFSSMPQKVYERLDWTSFIPHFA